VITKVAENRAEIVARSGKALSAFEIWDKLEKAKFTPSKLVMPDAEYTEKPPEKPSKPANSPATR
jgi:hypothetical protein